MKIFKITLKSCCVIPDTFKSYIRRNTVVTVDPPKGNNFTRDQRNRVSGVDWDTGINSISNSGAAPASQLINEFSKNKKPVKTTFFNLKKEVKLKKYIFQQDHNAAIG